MSDGATKVRSMVSMRHAQSYAGRVIDVDQGATVLYEGVYYPGRIMSCETPIRPGETGEVIIGILCSTGTSFTMFEGARFEIVDTPTKKVAEATVLEILDRNDNLSI